MVLPMASNGNSLFLTPPVFLQDKDTAPSVLLWMNNHGYLQVLHMAPVNDKAV